MEPSRRASRTVRALTPGDHVVVCGAGPAGLTAAYLLAKQGYEVTVLESDHVVGGISRTSRYKEFRFDIGGHRFFTKSTRVQALWDEFLGEEFLEVPRLSRIHYDGKYFDYPLRPLNALRGLGPLNAIMIGLSYLQAHLWPDSVEENFEQWVTNRFGRRLYEIFFKTYTEKVWGIPCSEIRAEWAAQRIQGLSLLRAVLSSASLSNRSPEIKSLINRFHYPRLGPGQMWEMCRDRILDMGGRVLMEHRVVGMEIQEGMVTSVQADTPEGSRKLEADHVINTISLRDLVKTFNPEAPTRVQRAAEGLRYRDFILVALVLDRDHLFTDNWIYVHTPGVHVGRVQNFNNWSASLVPVPGKTCLGMEYFCFRGDSLWNMGDDDLMELATRELVELALAPEARVEDGTVVRMPKAYPIYDGEYRQHLQAIRSFIDPISNLHTVGRNGMHKYNNQDHSMLTAVFAVENMGGASHDLWAVNTDFEYHEEQRVEREEPGLGEDAPRSTGSGSHG